MEIHPRRSVNKQCLKDLEMKVSSLITPEGTWKMDVLTELFPPDDVSRILAMQIGRVADIYIWAYNDHGDTQSKVGTGLSFITLLYLIHPRDH